MWDNIQKAVSTPGEDSAPITLATQMTHYSRAKRDYIDPMKQGTAYAGAESQRYGRPPRTYYYLPNAAYTEPHITNPEINTKHELNFKPEGAPRLVDMNHLPDHIFDAARKRSGAWSGPELATALEHTIKEHGYDGYHRDGVAALFHPVTVNDGTGHSTIHRDWED